MDLQTLVTAATILLAIVVFAVVDHLFSYMRKQRIKKLCEDINHDK